ncbi:MAG: hypothetical protein Q8909_13625 [Bacteroidota bacterium]|nr:hypothetical protein [Bacteroidota bacterium]
MRIKHYIQGDKRGKDAHRLEREAMGDPFLQEALDGYDSVPGNHADALERLERNIMHWAAAKTRRQLIINWSVAATLLLLIGLGGFFIFLNNQKNAPVVATTQKVKPTQSTVNKPEEIVREAEKQKQTTRFTPPVIKPDDQVNEEEEMVTQDKVMESTAAVGAVNFDKGTDDVTVEPQQTQGYIKEALIATTNRQNNDSLKKQQTERIALRELAMKKALQGKDDNTSVIQDTKPFGKKEFLEYCRNKAEKGLCGEDKSSVTVSFSINENGRPTDYKFRKLSCEKAKSEIEKLLNQSPIWTNPNQKVSVKISW